MVFAKPSSYRKNINSGRTIAAEKKVWKSLVKLSI